MSAERPWDPPKPWADPGKCPFCLRSIYTIRERGHGTPCPCPRLEEPDYDEQDREAAELRGED